MPAARVTWLVPKAVAVLAWLSPSSYSAGFIIWKVRIQAVDAQHKLKLVSVVDRIKAKQRRELADQRSKEMLDDDFESRYAAMIENVVLPAFKEYSAELKQAGLESHRKRDELKGATGHTLVAVVFVFGAAEPGGRETRCAEALDRTQSRRPHGQGERETSERVGAGALSRHQPSDRLVAAREAQRNAGTDRELRPESNRSPALA